MWGHQPLADKGIHCERCKSTLVNSSFCFTHIPHLNLNVKANWYYWQRILLILHAYCLVGLYEETKSLWQIVVQGGRVRLYLTQHLFAPPLTHPPTKKISLSFPSKFDRLNIVKGEDITTSSSSSSSSSSMCDFTGFVLWVHVCFIIPNHTPRHPAHTYTHPPDTNRHPSDTLQMPSTAILDYVMGQ